MALSWVQDVGFEQVILKLYGQIVIQGLNATTPDVFEFGVIISLCKQLLSELPLSKEIGKHTGPCFSHSLG